jgi:hypothetical protein
MWWKNACTCVYFLLIVCTLDWCDRSAVAEETIRIATYPPEQKLYSLGSRLPADAAVSVEVDIGDSSIGSAYYSLKVTLSYWRNMEMANQTLLDQPLGRMSRRQSLKLQLMSFNSFQLTVTVTNQVRKQATRILLCFITTHRRCRPIGQRRDALASCCG